jgi:parvulin-like peptidyl-prolyl isomerase
VTCRFLDLRSAYPFATGASPSLQQAPFDMTSTIQVKSNSAVDLMPLVTRSRLLPQLRRELAIDQAISSIDCETKEIELARQQFYANNQIVEAQQRQAWLDYYGMTQAELDELAVRELKLEKFKQSQWGNQLESVFFKHKAKFDKVLYSILRTSKPEIAQELFFRIQAGEQSFADAARQYAEGPEAQTGGLIGPVEVSQIHPILAQKLMASQPNQVHLPIQIDTWFVIVRLEKQIAAQLDQPTRQKLLDSLFDSWVQETIKQSTSPFS